MEFDEGHLRTLFSDHILSCMTISIKRERGQFLLLSLSLSLSLSLAPFTSFPSSRNMIKEFLKPKRELVLVENKEVRVMDQPELSLGPSETADSSSSESDANLCRKRKHTWDESMGTQTSIELQLNDPLPMDWEQCLDLQTGRMYYLNRKTLKKSWVRPKEQIDLELNISTLPNSEGKTKASSTTPEQYPRRYTNSSDSMVAVACLNCHLLVMLSKSSPSCPNCKYMHSLLPPQPRRIEAVKPLETLSLLH